MLGNQFLTSTTQSQNADCRNIPSGRDPQFEVCFSADELSVKDRFGNKLKVMRQEFTELIRELSTDYLENAGVALHLYRLSEMRLWVLNTSVGPNEETSFWVTIQGDFGGFAAPIEFSNRSQIFQSTSILGPDGLYYGHLGYISGAVLLETNEAVRPEHIEPFVARLGAQLRPHSQSSRLRWDIEVTPFSEIGFCATAMSDMTRPLELSACRLLPTPANRVTLVEPAFDLGMLAP
jgi:hypothetical protein